MDTYDKLQEYHIQQGSIISARAERLSKQGFVKNCYDIYPDLKGLLTEPDSSISYVRGNVPLKLTSLIYDKTIVYLPPWPQELIEKRFGLSYKEFLTLCRSNIVIPIIGDVHNYTAEHFIPLFHLKNPPPSLWARGLVLLDVFGMGDTLDAARRKIPVDKIAADPLVQSKWKSKMPYADEEAIQKAIMDDVAVMYADLCIFGYAREAQELGKFRDTQKIYESLQILNEAITYPVLFGLNSQPTYHLEKLENSLSKLYIAPRYPVQPLPVPPDLEVLLQGIGINIDVISVEEIMRYRQDGLGAALRKTLNSFTEYCNAGLGGKNALDRDNILAYAEAFQKQVKCAIEELTPSAYQRFHTVEKSVVTSLKIGGFGIGGLLGYMADGSLATIAGISGFAGAVLSELLTYPKAKEAVDWIVQSYLSAENPKYMVNLWECKKIVNPR